MHIYIKSEGKKTDVKVIHRYLVGFPMNKLENGPMNHWRAGRRRIFPHEIIMPFCLYLVHFPQCMRTKNACWSIQNSYHDINLNPKHSNTSLKLDKGNHLLNIH